MSRGLLFDIKEFAVHDGPGIRKTVFFKGCPLHCSWCHNPEGISPRPQLMFNPARCTDCGACAEVCPTGAAPRDLQRCEGCGICVRVCPAGAREICGREISAVDLVADLMKDMKFFSMNGGGATFSGGEPLAQPEFLLELLTQLYGKIHLTLDTSGYAPTDIFAKALTLVDLVLFDLKHTDPQMHRRFTGEDNRLVLENLGVLKNSAKPFILRVPLIPGITDTRENMEASGQLVRGAAGLVRVELLPYHMTAAVKYARLGRPFRPGFDVEREVRVYQRVFEDRGMRSLVL